MRDGLYKVHFKTRIGEGAGVIVLSGGHVRGGDSSVYYVGTYEQAGNQFTASVAAKTHTRMPGMGNVFGVDNVDIKLAGTSTGDSANVTGTAAQAPGVQFHAELSRLSD
ncbi:MAG: GrlR family regulatory protein [Rhizomicrobium sp.]